MKVVKAITSLTLVLAFIVACAATIRVKFTEKEVDLGEVNRGQTYEHIFICQNNSDEPLTISSIGGACGCNIISYTKTPIAKGDMGEIRVKYTPKKSDEGLIIKSFQVQFNDGQLTEYLYLKGNMDEAAK